jgi:hypothetical protein
METEPVGFIEGFGSQRELARSFRSGLPDRSSVLCRLLTPAASSTSLLRSTLSVAGAHVPQASPDKDANFNCTTAAFTVEAQPRTSVCWATSSASSALYAISVRRLTALISIFLPTVPRGSAVDFV